MKIHIKGSEWKQYYLFGDSLHDMSNPVFFRKIIIILLSAELARIVFKVKRF